MRFKIWLGSIVGVVVAIMASSVAHASPPQITVTPSPHDYGSLRVANAATTTASQTFTVGNAGSTTLTISSVTVVGTNPGDFTITADTGEASLDMGQTRSITVRFDPSAAGARSAALRIASNDMQSPTDVALTGTGTSAVIAVTDVNFGSVLHGTTATDSITVSNNVATDQGPLHVASASISGGGGWFTFDTNSPASCLGATTCNLNTDVTTTNLAVGVRCSPPAGAAGPQTATVTFTSDTDPTGADATATLTCTGPPDINLVTTSVAFGDVPVNPATAPTRTVTIGNTGNQTLTFTASKVASTFSSFYSLSGCFSACNVAPGATRQLTVTFNPTLPTNPDANITLSVASNDPDTPSATIPVTGRGIAPQIDAPASLAFGTVEVGKTSTAQALTITNTGTATLVISNASFSAGGTEYTALTGTTGPQMTQVPPSGTVTWDLVCNPTADGPRPGTFQIVSNSFTQSTATVSLTCDGERGLLAVSPTSINFGAVESGTVATRTFTLSNAGNLPVTNIAAAVSPATVGYSIDPAGNPVPTSLAPGASVLLTVRFAPLSGADGGNAAIAFTGDWGVTPTQTTATLSLSGLPAGYDLSTATLDFGDLRFDKTLDKTFCITNTGQSTVRIQSPISIAPASGTLTGEFTVVRIQRPTTCGGTSTMDVTLPQDLSQGQLLQVTVRADPANRTGAMQATLTVTSNLTGNPTRTLTLLGNSTTGAFALAPGSLIDFGAVDVLGAAVSKTITFTNTGTGALDLTNFQRSTNGSFTFTVPGNTQLTPGQSLDIVVAYKPTTASPVGSEEKVTLTNQIAGDIDGPTSNTITLQGRGIDRDIDVAATPVFPDTFRNPGDQAPVRAVKIRNLGEVTLKVTALMLNNDAGVWQLVDASPVDIPKGASQELRVRFAPTTAAHFEAKLVIAHDDRKRAPVSVDLIGNGIDRSVRFTPDSIRIGYTPVGEPLTFDDALVVTSTDPTHAFLIRSIEVDDTSLFAIEGVTPDLELPALGQRTFSVTFTPEAAGPFTTKARLYLDVDPVAQHEVTIQGVAVFVDAHGGGGCAAGGAGGSAGGAALALAAVLGLRRRRRAAVGAAAAAGAAATAGPAALALALALAFAPAAASADDIVLSVFDPVPATTSNGFQLLSPDVGKSGDWVASAVFSHATDPLILDGLTDNGLVNDYAVVSRSTVMNVGSAVAFLGRFEAGARLPLYMQDGQPTGDPLIEFTERPAHGTARGDLALHAKARLLHRRLEGDGALIAGASAQLTLPTATPDQFTGAGDPSGRVLLLGSLMPGAFERRVTLTMNLGGVIRAPQTYANLEQKSGIAWGLGATVRALDELWLAGEVYGDTVPAGRTDLMTRSRVLSPIEWLGGVRWKPDRRFTVGLAAGRGLTNAIGTPGFRGVLSLTLTPGAPELGPIRPPRPDGDADGDGVRDSVDRCPGQPEDQDGFDDGDGCPDEDNDGDGIPDAQDKCPIDAEDKDGFADADGCPDRDNDGDGIPDAQDKCPNQPEDRDGFADVDGCPDPDNDRDGIPDAKDRCPGQPETINGNQDDDGCPDKGDSLVVLSPDRLDTLDMIQFTAGQKVAKASQNLLGQVGATLRARTEIARLRITVHVQPTTDPDRDQEITDQRAAAVRDWLVQWGVAPERLEARGFGGTKPIVPPDRKGAAALNTRVELIILERK